MITNYLSFRSLRYLLLMIKLQTDKGNGYQLLNERLLSEQAR